MFEAKGIQRYIFASGKLRDVVGASDLVAGLANSDGDDKIKEFAGGLSFSRRAGGAFCIHSESKEPLVALRAKWRHYVLRALPGLEFVDVIVGTDSDNPLEAMRQCFREAGGIRSNYPAEVPGLGRPISQITRLTGRPAVAELRYGKDDRVLVDAIGLPQRVHAERNKDDSELIASRFVSDASQWKFPRNYDDGPEVDADHNPLFPFRNGDDKRIAVIHADLSGLGELFRKMGDAQGFTPALNFNLAKQIEDAITKAVQGAVAEFILPYAVDQVVPARPVLLGGDDITIIVRADLAVPFTIQLLKNIESECEQIGKADGYNALSACAGIAIVGKGTPFLTAYALADDLCRHAKQKVKASLDDHEGRNGYASAYSFHVYQHTALDGYEGAIADNEVDAEGTPLSANPYWVGQRAGTGAIDLVELAQSLASVEGGHNRVREIKSLISDNRALAEVAWRRWWEVGDKKQSDEMEALARFLGSRTFNDGSSGIFDAMTLIDLGAVPEKQTESAA
jgi:hypothetical protein